MSPNSRKKKSVSLPKFSLEAEKNTPDEGEQQRQKQLLAEKAAALTNKVRVEKPLAAWAADYGVPCDIARQAMDDFLEFVSKPPEKRIVSKDGISFGTPFDVTSDLGSMDSIAFGKAILRIADVKSLADLPDGFMDLAMKSADKNDSNDIDFAEFLQFYYKFTFSEEFLIGNKEREIRMAARDYDIPFDEIGRYKYVFDQADTDGGGTIDFDEFRVLLNKLLKTPKTEQLCDKRCNDMWKEATRVDREGHVTNVEELDFCSFVGWYQRCFAGAEANGESANEAFYKNIRRVC